MTALATQRSRAYWTCRRTGTPSMWRPPSGDMPEQLQRNASVLLGAAQLMAQTAGREHCHTISTFSCHSQDWLIL
jgi:hypothetical protein